LPQIRWTSSRELFEELPAGSLSLSLITIVEKAFNLSGLNDVTFTAAETMFTENECDIQIEVRYSVGYEYEGRGYFEPSDGEKKKLADLIIGETKKIALDRTVSVWIIPYEKTVFKYTD